MTRPIALCALALGLAACTRADAPPATPSGPADPPVSLDAPPAVEPVASERLQGLLPPALGTLARTGVEASGEGTLGFATTEASAAYGGPGAARIALRVQDLGSPELAAMMGLAWTSAEVDRQMGPSFERTVRLGGHPAYEAYDAATRTGEVQVLVGGRFLVEAEGSGVEAGQIRAAVEAVGLSTLEGLGGQGGR